MMWAPASAAMLRAARPKAEVAPRITRVWPSLISKLRCRHVQAVAYDSGITANSSHDRSVLMGTTLVAGGHVYSAELPLIVRPRPPMHAATFVPPPKPPP